MTASERAAACVSRLIAANLIAAPFDDTPEPMYYSSIVALLTDSIREDREAMRERCALKVEGFKTAPHGSVTYWGEGLAAAIRALPLD
jgi:hypothetical protein